MTELRNSRLTKNYKWSESKRLQATISHMKHTWAFECRSWKTPVSQACSRAVAAIGQLITIIAEVHHTRPDVDMFFIWGLLLYLTVYKPTRMNTIGYNTYTRSISISYIILRMRRRTKQQLSCLTLTGWCWCDIPFSVSLANGGRWSSSESISRRATVLHCLAIWEPISWIFSIVWRRWRFTFHSWKQDESSNVA